jgi:glycosyltransferase involved in cell wall biosynthesis
MITGFLGDVRFHALGRSGRRTQGQGAALAAEYVRRAVDARLRAPHADVAVAASHFIPDAAALTGATRGGAYGVAYIYHLVTERSDRTLRTIWSKADERLSLSLIRRSAGTIFTSNTETFTALRKRGIEPTRTNVGLDISSFRVGDPARALPVGVFISRLVPKKGLLDAVEAWASVAAVIPEARLIVAGTGPELIPAKKRADELGISRLVSWRGFVSESEKRELLATSRVLVAPSYEEGWGIAVAEALASGLPVVGYRLPTLDEIFGDVYRAVLIGDIDALADGIIGLLRDDCVAGAVSAVGHHTVRRFDVDRVAQAELKTILAARDAATGSRAPAVRRRRPLVR